MIAASIERGVSTLHVSSVPDSTTVAEEIVATQIHCEDEPIRVPGAVQQHGFLLVTDGDLNTILMASENAERFLELPLRLILGSRIDTLLERELLSSLQLLRLGGDPDREGQTTFLGSFRVSSQFFSVVSHSVGVNRVSGI